MYTFLGVVGLALVGWHLWGWVIVYSDIRVSLVLDILLSFFISSRIFALYVIFYLRYGLIELGKNLIYLRGVHLCINIVRNWGRFHLIDGIDALGIGLFVYFGRVLFRRLEQTVFSFFLERETLDEIWIVPQP